MEHTSHRKATIVVPIRGLLEGTRAFEDTVSSASIAGIVPEISGEVHVIGEVNRIGSRFRVKVSISASAQLICDRSLEKFEEPITASAEYEFILDSDLAEQQSGELFDSDVVKGLATDAAEIDITDDVRQELALAIPMRRVAPHYRGLELDEIYPTSNVDAPLDEAEVADDRWAALKKLRQS